jgi:hypothetical protein
MHSKSFFSIFWILLSLFLLNGCGLLKTRNDVSSSVVKSEQDDFDMKQYELRNKVAQEMGYESYQKLAPFERQDVEDRIALERGERLLQSKREREQYYNFKPYLKNDRERLDFIRLGTYENRERYLQRHGLLNGTEQRSDQVADMIRKQDITVGMTKQAVRESWGDPDAIEVAGNPMYGNERWKYTQDVASADGFKTKNRVVFFEGGVVSGWESK